MRVALDFEWPLDKNWVGYVNPHYVECRWCRGLASRTPPRV